MKVNKAQKQNSRPQAFRFGASIFKTGTAASPQFLLPNHPLQIPGLRKAQRPAVSTLLPDHAMLLVHGPFGYFSRTETFSVPTQFRVAHRLRLPAPRARGRETLLLGCEHAHNSLPASLGKALF